MNKYLANMIAITAIVALLLIVVKNWIDVNLYGYASIIAAGIYGICINLHALIKGWKQNKSS
ncbi:hypothetical protein SAMN05421663_10887 [Terribacillus halophilus]|uniref:Uncharacterized protein n=1 Tax=Terribacillus halophilus TaxID=361279 RepID=A0A1G6T8E5_9BACI|nr:hypothetical protein [Terribacillus halophilus]SDD25328.1 hypothetical protein SAMN05421663_10887 [Terribacillus halophilus]